MATLDLGVRHREARRLPMSRPRPNADQVRSCSARQRGLVSAGDGNSAVRGVCLGARRVVPAARLSVGSRFSKRTLDDRRDASRAELPILRRPRGSRRVFQIRRFCESARCPTAAREVLHRVSDSARSSGKPAPASVSINRRTLVGERSASRRQIARSRS
jgi:hypothetical protein